MLCCFGIEQIGKRFKIGNQIQCWWIGNRIWVVYVIDEVVFGDVRIVKKKKEKNEKY